MSNDLGEYSNSSINETFIYDFEDFDSMDHVNVLAYFVMSIRKYENISLYFKKGRKDCYCHQHISLKNNP